MKSKFLKFIFIFILTVSLMPVGVFSFQIKQVQAAAIIGTNTFTQGWATFGQAVPQGQAFGGLQVGSLATQTDVKNTWPDGSIKFAVVTAYIPAAGNYAIASSSASSGSFIPTIPTANATFNVAGINYTAALPNTTSSDTWLNGPLVREWRSIVTPLLGSTPHPLLRVYFDTRVYNDGKARVDVDVENTLDVVGGQDVTYNVTINVNGSSVFTQSAVTHWYLSRWRKTFSANGLVEAETYQDFGPYLQTGAIPQYDAATISNPTYSFTDTYVGNNGVTYPRFGILGLGGSGYADMWAPGGRAELGPYPDWVASYEIYKNSNLRTYTIANGNEAGSWSAHIREADGSFINLNNRPNFWLDPRCGGGADCPKGNMNSDNPIFNVNNSHVPSLAYVPYIITGDRYFVDEMKFWADAAVELVWPACGVNYSYCRANNIIMDGESPRGIGWALRNIVDAAYVPDNDSFKSYFMATAKNNLAALDQFSLGQIQRNGQYVNPYGSTFEDYSPNGNSTPVGVAQQPQWQNNYIAWSLDHALALGFTSGTAARNRIVNYQLKLFTSDPGYPIGYAAPYYPVTGIYRSDGVTIDWFQNLTDLYNWNVIPTNNPYFGTLNQFSGYYGTDARLSLITAIKLGLPGAKTAYDWLMQKLSVSTDLNGRWGISLGAIGNPTPLLGDLNLDHIVNSIDYSIMNSQWFTSNSQSDLNKDGIVNSLDYSIMNSNWFKTW
jgi:hypothetical protein